MLWTVMACKGISDKDYEELLNGFDYELKDELDEEAMMLLWDEAAESTSSENEMDYDEPEEWWF